MKQHSRKRKFALNFVFEILLEIITGICGFIVPRLILSYFGSADNGLIQSITQFLGCIAILRSGIGSVMRAALYKPLAEKNYSEISSIVKATEKFLRKISYIFILFTLVFAFVYPFIVRDEFDWLFSSSLVIILSISTFAQYYFGLTYQMLIQADQSNYVLSITQIVCVILNTVASYILIKLGFSIHIVKLATAIIFALQPVVYMLYAKKKYKISKDVEPKNHLISERWDAFGHQLASFINSNTDIIVATVFLGVKEVSVYSVIYMVANAIKKIVMAISNSITGAFGNMMAKKETALLEKRFSQYELIMYTLSSLLFSVTFVSIFPFLSIYTRGITDINYVREGLIIAICITEFFTCIKLPYQMIIYAHGDFKKTKWYAYIEAAINIVLSLILVNQFGLTGIVIGTCLAAVFQSIVFSRYMSTKIINHATIKTVKCIVTSLCTNVLIIAVSRTVEYVPNTYLEWALYSLVLFIASTIIGFVCLVVINYKDAKAIIKFMTVIMKKVLKKCRLI